MSGHHDEPAMEEPFEARLRDFFHSIDEPPVGLEARIDRGLERGASGGSGGRHGFFGGRDWQQLAAMAAAAVFILVAVALVVTTSNLGPGPSPSGAVGPSAAASSPASAPPTGAAPSGAGPSIEASPSAGASPIPETTPTATPAPTPEPTPAPTPHSAGSLVSLPAMSPYLDGPAVNLDGVHILVAGGTSLNAGGIRTRTNLAMLYDESTHQWTATGPMTEPRYDHTATLLRDGRVLVTGGSDMSDGVDNQATAEIYDPATGTWSPTGSMSRGRAGHTATLLADGRVLVAGGYGGGTLPTATAEIWDPATGIWTSTGSMTVPRMNHTATLIPGGKVLVTGGVDDMSNVLASAEIWDPATGKWTATGSMTTQREWQTATLLADDRLLVVGGTGGSATSPVALASAEIWDPATGRFTATGSMATPRYGQTSTLLIYGQVVVAGGVGTNSLEIWWPDTGRFGFSQKLAGPVSAAVSMSERVLIVGSPPEMYCSWAAKTTPCQ